MLKILITTFATLCLVHFCTAQFAPDHEEEEFGMANEEVLLEKIYNSDPEIDQKSNYKIQINQEHLPQNVDKVIGKLNNKESNVTEVYEYSKSNQELYYEVNFKKQGKRSRYLIDEEGKMVEEVILGQKDQ